jgi:hypothetical protein
VFTATAADGRTVAETTLDRAGYAAWVNWVDPTTGASMGVPRTGGQVRGASPRFIDININGPHAWSVAAHEHPDIGQALDAAHLAAADEIRRWVAAHAVARVGAKGCQVQTPADLVHTVTVTHHTSSYNRFFWHTHLHVGTRVRTHDQWRALQNRTLFYDLPTIRSLGAATLARHPDLTAALASHGLTHKGEPGTDGTHP